MTSLQSKTPPTNAFRFEAPLEFAKQSKDAPASDTKSRAITMLARTNKVIEHWYWGRCVHDFSGMVHADRIILDYCHGDDIIGYADQFIVDERGLTLNGRVESVQPDDEAELLLKRMDRGIPYQSSIYFDEVVLDWVPEGFSAEVNGQTIPGPLTIFKKWLLRASSACPHGYDSDSNTSSTEQSFSTKFSWTNPMSATNPTTTQQSPDAREELKAFVTKFGTDGVTYFQNKLSMSDAALTHIDTLGKRHTDEVAKLTAAHTEATTKLSAELESVKKERDEAANRLKAAQLSHGESSSIDVGSPKKTEDGKGAKGFGQFVRPR